MYVQFALYGVSKKIFISGREIWGAQKMKKMQEKMAFLQLLSFVIQITLKIKTEA